jgi:hypothetical protein
MQKIPLNLAKPGMVLAKPVPRQDGIVVVASGTEITEGLLDKLQSMEVETIVVEGNPVNMDGVMAGSSYATRIARLDHLFRKFPDDPWMGRVREMFRAYFTVKAASSGSAGTPGDAPPKSGE